MSAQLDTTEVTGQEGIAAGEPLAPNLPNSKSLPCVPCLPHVHVPPQNHHQVPGSWPRSLSIGSSGPDGHPWGHSAAHIPPLGAACGILKASNAKGTHLLPEVL